MPAAEGLVASARPDHLGRETSSLPPHITVLYPFLPAHRIQPSDIRQLLAVAATSKPFRFSLSHLARFPGVLYLAPEDARPFVELTFSFNRPWPGVRPYDGAFDEVVPHVTVLTGPEPSGIVESLEPLLPIEATASTVVLAMRGWRGRWRRLAAFPLSAD